MRALRPHPGATRVRCAWLLAALLGLLLGLPAPARGESQLLEDGVLRQVEVPAGGVWAGNVRVPRDATALTVIVCARTETALYLRHGEGLESAPEALADISRVGADPMHVVRLADATPLRLRSGTWHVAVVADPEAAGEPIEVIAFVDRGRGVPTVVAGGGELALPVHRDRPELRTYLPSIATNLKLTIQGADRPGVRYRLDGPQNYRRDGPATDTIVLSRPEAPGGAYTLDLAGQRRGTLPATVRVAATWTSPLGDTPSSDPQPLVLPGTEQRLTLGGGGPTSRTVRIPVPPDTGGIEIEARTPQGADVDLYVRRGGPLEAGDQDADYFALSNASTERLYLGGIAGLAAGMYWCEAVLVEGEGPVQVTIAVRRYPRGAQRGTWGAEAPPPLVPDRWVRGRVESTRGGVTWYAIDVPAGARSFHAMLLESSAPLDLVFARRTDGSIMRRALSARVDERIDHTFRTPPDSRRLFLLGVMNRNALEEIVDYRVAFSINRPPEPPTGIPWPPLLN